MQEYQHGSVLSDSVHEATEVMRSAQEVRCTNLSPVVIFLCSMLRSAHDWKKYLFYWTGNHKTFFDQKYDRDAL